jgi:hypothetical protein
MNVRPDYVLIGNLVKLYGSLSDDNGLPINSADAKLILKSPDDERTEFNLIMEAGKFSMDFLPDSVGRWEMRFECQTPTPVAGKSFFVVTPSNVDPES